MSIEFKKSEDTENHYRIMQDGEMVGEIFLLGSLWHCACSRLYPCDESNKLIQDKLSELNKGDV